MDISVALFAACANKYQMLKYLVANGCSLDQSVLAGAADCANLQMVLWLKRVGCPMGEEALRNIRKIFAPDVLTWMVAVEEEFED